MHVIIFTREINRQIINRYLYIDWLCIQTSVGWQVGTLESKKRGSSSLILHPMTNSIYFGTQLCYEEAGHKKQKERSVMGVERATQGP